MNFVAVCTQRRADRAHKLSFGHGEQQLISRSNPAQAPAPARRFAVHFIAIKRRPRIDFKVLVTWASHPWLQSTCIGRHRNALAYSPCLAFGFFFPHVEASFDPTITELEQHAVPAFDRFGSTFVLKIFCNKYVITPLRPFSSGNPYVWPAIARDRLAALPSRGTAQQFRETAF